MLVCGCLLVVVMDNHNYCANNGREMNWLDCEKEDICIDNDGEAICPRPYRKEVERNDELVHVLSHEELSRKLLSQVVHSGKEAYELYYDCGHHMGFSIKKGKQTYIFGIKKNPYKELLLLKRMA